MRQAVGSTWIFGIVLAFTLIFSGFLVLALSYSKAYKLKNEMTSIIEKYEGITKTDKKNNLGSIQIMNDYLKNSGYKAKGHCYLSEYTGKVYGVDNLSDNYLTEVTEANQSNNFYYCVSYNSDKKSCTTLFTITVFYDFNLPVLGDIRQYSVTGQTNEIYKAYFEDKQISC